MRSNRHLIIRLFVSFSLFLSLYLSLSLLSFLSLPLSKLTFLLQETSDACMKTLEWILLAAEETDMADWVTKYNITKVSADLPYKGINVRTNEKTTQK